MTKPHPLLEDKMIVFVGEDPRAAGRYYALEYNKSRFTAGSRCICFAENIPILERLGIHVGPHWNTSSQIKGYYAATGLRYHEITNLDSVEVDPLVTVILSKTLTNKSFKMLLSEEND